LELFNQTVTYSPRNPAEVMIINDDDYKCMLQKHTSILQNNSSEII